MASNTNFAVWNELTKGSYSGLTNGNTTLSSISNSDLAGTIATMGITTGKFYWEIYIHDNGSGYIYGGLNSGYEGGGFYSGASTTNGMTPGAIRIRNNGTLSDSSGNDDPDRWGTITLTSTGVASFTNGDIIGFALDYDNKKLWISKNGTFFNSGDPAGGSNQQASWDGDVPIIYPAFEPYAVGTPNNGGTVNFGQDSSFSGNKTSGSAAATDGNGYGDFYYSPPSGYLALCSANLPVSDDIDPAQTDDNYPGKQFNTVLFNGNGTTNAVTGLGFQPDFIWGFTRSGSQSKRMIDSSRGGASRLYSDLYGAADTSQTAINSFDSDGFTANGGYFNNDSGKTCGAWCWRMNGGTTATNNDGNVTTTVQANSAAGQSIVQWTGTGTNSRTLGTGLSKKAEFIMVKDISTGTYYWVLYHKNANAGSLPGDYGVVYLNTNSAYSSGSGALTYWDVSEFTDSVFSVGGSGGTNTSGNSMLAYCFHSVDGYSKFGSYTGNGNADGPFIYLGFRPAMIFFKRTDSTSGWTVVDTARYTDNNNNGPGRIEWNTSSTETTGSSALREMDVLSNGIKLRTSNGNVNTNGGDYIFGAWSDVPLKYNNTF